MINAKWVPLLYGIPLGLVLMAVIMMLLGSRSNGPSAMRKALSAGFARLGDRLPRIGTSGAGATAPSIPGSTAKP